MFAARNLITAYGAAPPVSFDTVGTASVVGNNATSINLPITISGSAVLVGIYLNISQGAAPNVTAAIGSNSFTSIRATTNFASQSGAYFSFAVLGLLNPPTGSQTIALSFASTGTGGQAYSQAFSYKNVKSFGTQTNTSGTSSSMSLNSSSTASGNAAFNMFCSFKYAASCTISSYNQTSRFLANNFAYLGTMSMVMGDAAGAGSAITFSGSQIGTNWAGMTVPLLNS